MNEKSVLKWESINNILPTKDASRMKNRFLHKVANKHKFQNKHKGELQGKLFFVVLGTIHILSQHL